MSQSPQVMAFAQRVCDRLTVGRYGFDPATIMLILQLALPALMNCFKKNDEPSPQRMQAELAKQYRRDPKGTRKRIARQLRRQEEREGRSLTKVESFEIAQAIIDETLATDQHELVGAISDLEGA